MKQKYTPVEINGNKNQLDLIYSTRIQSTAAVFSFHSLCFIQGLNL